jgi:hypothetical protein
MAPVEGNPELEVGCRCGGNGSPPRQGSLNLLIDAEVLIADPGMIDP